VSGSSFDHRSRMSKALQAQRQTVSDIVAIAAPVETALTTVSLCGVHLAPGRLNNAVKGIFTAGQPRPHDL
jgi:hypothetical protein